MKKLLLITSLFAVVALAGCKDPYGTAVKAGNAIASGIGPAMQTVDSTRVNGLISPAEELNILGYLKFVNDADGAFLNCVSVVHTSGGAGTSYTSCAQTLNTALNTPEELALIKVSNPSGQQEVTALVNTLTTGINALIVGLGGK